MATINVFLSDIHIGSNAPTNWYQASVHQPYLKAILKYVQDNASQVQDFIILGDWFDRWMYPPDVRPPGITEILTAPTNQGIFTRQADGSGDFVSCLDGIQGQMRFVNGNHDMTATCQEINDYFRLLSQKGRQVICETAASENLIYQSGDIYAEHGHMYSLFNRPDNNEKNKVKPLPLGYFISRTVSLIATQVMQKQGKANAALLPDSGNPTFSFESVGYDIAYIEKLLSKDLTLAQALLFDLVSKSGNQPETLFYTMPDGTTISAQDAADMFPDLSIEDWAALMVDIANSLDNESEKLHNRVNKRVLLMGHTHVPRMLPHPFGIGTPQWVYVNSGFDCADKPGMDAGTSYPSFVEVEAVGGYEVRLKKVDYPQATISTVNSTKVP